MTKLKLADMASGMDMPGPMPSGPEKPKKILPRVTIDIASMKDLGDIEVGDSGTMTASFKAVSMSMDEEIGHVTLELDNLELVDRRNPKDKEDKAEGGE